MPQREPARRQTAGEPPGAKVKMRLGADGRWVPVLPPEPEPAPAGEAAEPEPAARDPRETPRRPDRG